MAWESDTFRSFYFEICHFVKIGTKLWHVVNILIQSVARCKIFHSKYDTSNFLKGTPTLREKFEEIITTFQNSAYNFWHIVIFLIVENLIINLTLSKILIQFLTSSKICFKVWHVLIFLTQNLASLWNLSPKFWHVVNSLLFFLTRRKILNPNRRCCNSIIQNLTCCKNLDSKRDTL